MLDNVVSSLTAKVLERYYGGDESKIPVVDYLGVRHAHVPPLPGVHVLRAGDEIKLTLSASLPAAEHWLQVLAGSELNWWHAFVQSEFVVQGTSYIANPLRRILVPRAGQKINIRLLDGQPNHISIYGAARLFGEHQPDFLAVDIRYDVSPRLINLTLFEERQGTAVPLSLQFRYEPSQPYAPIHEIAEGRNKRIKEFYWRMWFGDDEDFPELDVRDTFTGPEVTISAGEVEAFCAVVGNQQEEFKTVRTDEVRAPMDFAIVTGWQAIMKGIFPSAIDGDLLKLVHLSNGFKMIPGSRPVKAGDVCRAEARVVAVVNGDSGKTVRVSGLVLCEGNPIMEVQSAFFFRGNFTDYEHTFETIDEPEYTVELATDADVGVLMSKDWFEWADEDKPLTAGARLIFRLRSEVTYKDRVNYRSVSVAGDVLARDHLGRLVKVAYVDFERDESQGNPVVAYLQRHGSAKSVPIPLATEYHLTSDSNPSLYHAPYTNEPYSRVSGDFNPIHTNPYFAAFASLPGTITHGMFSSAATRRYVETVVAMGVPDRVFK
jgi:fatty acid synthase subunit alpha